jgi:hypothetical protein
MVLPLFYVDAFEQARSRHASVEGIYMSFANASTKEHRSANSRILLCLVPTGCNIFKAVHIVIIYHMQLLERGIKVKFAGSGKKMCYSSTYAMLGDHPSQAKLAGISPKSFVLPTITHIFFIVAGLGGTGWASCHYCQKPSMLFPFTSWPCKQHGSNQTIPKPGKQNPNSWHVRHKEAIMKSRSQVVGVVGKGRDTLKYRGWSTKATSPFCELLWMRCSFFLCFRICTLHLKLLGNVKVH